VIVADEWQRISRQVDKGNLSNLFEDSDDLIRSARQVSNRSADKAKPYECSASDKIEIKGLMPELSELTAHLSELFSNGYVISSIASSIGLMYGNEQAILYMNGTHRHPGNDGADLYFYMVRAKAMYLARWYPREQAKMDLDQARDIADRIAITTAYRASIVNRQLYFPIRDWLEGHPLPRDEIPRLQRWARELRDLLDQDWAKQQNYDRDRDDPADTNFLIPAAYDTLGMSELAIWVSTSDLRRERCAQAAVDFTIAKGIFHRLFELYPAEYQDPLRISEAHREFRDNLCGQ
jgi:hypothetical protein